MKKKSPIMKWLAVLLTAVLAIGFIGPIRAQAGNNQITDTDTVYDSKGLKLGKVTSKMTTDISGSLFSGYRLTGTFDISGSFAPEVDATPTKKSSSPSVCHFEPTTPRSSVKRIEVSLNLSFTGTGVTVQVSDKLQAGVSIGSSGAVVFSKSYSKADYSNLNSFKTSGKWIVVGFVILKATEVAMVSYDFVSNTPCTLIQSLAYKKVIW